jgi:ADP-ribosyl-[dinitrogen reductase] hydrolase
VGAALHDPPPRIDWIPASDFADELPGSVGMTVLPGKHGPSLRYPGRVYAGNLDQDLAALRTAGVVRLVLLVDDEELRRWGDREIVRHAATMGVDVDRHPIPDGGTPLNQRAMDAIIGSISEGRANGDVAVACMGGVGRSGTVVACALVAAGWDPEEAIGRVRRARHPTAVETHQQEVFVRKFHLARRG